MATTPENESVAATAPSHRSSCANVSAGVTAGCCAEVVAAARNSENATSRMMAASGGTVESDHVLAHADEHRAGGVLGNDRSCHGQHFDGHLGVFAPVAHGQGVLPDRDDRGEGGADVVREAAA